jgi:hypothetical protein
VGRLWGSHILASRWNDDGGHLFAPRPVGQKPSHCEAGHRGIAMPQAGISQCACRAARRARPRRSRMTGSQVPSLQLRS